jgi:hypothetical protein
MSEAFGAVQHLDRRFEAMQRNQNHFRHGRPLTLVFRQPDGTVPAWRFSPHPADALRLPCAVFGSRSRVHRSIGEP